MTDEKRDESRDILVDAYGFVEMVSRCAPFHRMICAVSGGACDDARARYSPTNELEAALKRVAELETATQVFLDEMIDVGRPCGIGRAVVHGYLGQAKYALERVLAKREI